MGLIGRITNRRWKSVLQGDEMVEVGTAEITFTPRNGPLRSSRGVVVVGRNRIGLASSDMQNEPVDTVVLEQHEVVMSINDAGSLVMESEGGWRYEVSQIEDRRKVLRALGIED